MLRYLAFLAAALLIAWAAFEIGQQNAGSAAKLGTQLRRELNIANRERGELRQQLAIAEKNGQLDRMAAETVRKEIVAYRQQIAGLQRDVDFYRSLMAPGEDNQGLAIHALEINHSVADQRFHYQVTIKQVGNGNLLLKGKLDVLIDLRESASGTLETRRLAELPDFSGSIPAVLRFRFFQTVSGSFKLPAGYVPVSMTLSATSSGKAQESVKRTYEWQELTGEH